MPTTKTTPKGVWVITQTSTRDPYPCRCHPDRKCTRTCPCRGRTDHLNLMPNYCCTRHTRR